jgi:choloylglycine hydrolase
MQIWSSGNREQSPPYTSAGGNQMIRRAAQTLLLCSLLLGSWQASEGCTSFFIDHQETRVVGKSYDWTVTAGLVMVNQRGVAKPFAFNPEADGRRWISRFGSVTFNQYGRDNPQGGVNEQGLVIEILWLASTRYPEVDDRLRLDSTRWIQYQLDTAASVEEVISSFDKITVSSSATVHYLIADRHGHAATIEFIDGELVCHRAGTLPVAVLTNNTYDESVAYLQNHEGWGGNRPIPTSNASLDRFVRASTLVRAFANSQQSAVDHAFSVLDSVASSGWTRWQIVYDLVAMTVSFRTVDSPCLKAVALNTLDFECGKPIKILEMSIDHPGDLSDYWIPYSRAANRKLIETAFSGTSFLRNVPPEVRERLAGYPETTSCAR